MASLTALKRKHDRYDDVTKHLQRWRDFSTDMEDSEAKERWLPKGATEWVDQYKHRLKITRNLGWARPMLNRMTGSLTKNESSLLWDKSTVSADDRILIEALRENFDGSGRRISQWWRDELRATLRDGFRIVEGVKTKGKEDPKSRADEGEVFFCSWAADELWDFGVDAKGNPEWVKLVTTTKKRKSWGDTPKKYRVFRIVTTEEVIVYEEELDRGDQAAITELEPTEQWNHGLGICPIVPMYARKTGPMSGDSYIDEISLADARLLQLESDQSQSSYQSGNPLLKIFTTRFLGSRTVTTEDGERVIEGLGIGTSQALKLRPKGGRTEGDEDVEYVKLDATGMEIRERIISRTMTQALNAAGVDPGSVTQGEDQGGDARSGASIAWSFSTAEEPALNDFTDGMETAEARFMEIAIRYYASGVINPTERAFDAVVKRERRWDLMSAETTLDLTTASMDIVKSRTFRDRAQVTLAKAVLPRESEETIKAIEEEVAAYKEPLPPEAPGFTEELLELPTQEVA